MKQQQNQKLEPRILIEQPGSTENFALIRSKGDQATPSRKPAPYWLERGN
ncbi:MAG: hypothetical protein HGB36_14140 [Chlorobiaceae bacterium]|nr:hypothetical protein [Chlorobiaceae bacterium]